jgi:hypothetical protein
VSAQSVIRWLAWVLTAISFLGSWSHCYERVLAAGQGERLSLVIATLPEVSVLVALLAWMSGERSVWVLLTGVSAFAFTITANWQTAQAGMWSHTVAVWPAWSAITALLLTHGSARTESGTERLSDVSARVSVEVSTHAHPERSLERSQDQLSAHPLTPALSERSPAQAVSAQPLSERSVSAHPLIERSQDQLSERSVSAQVSAERSPAQAMSDSECSLSAHRSQDQLSERSQDQLPLTERSQDQLGECSVSVPARGERQDAVINDTSTNYELPETTQERISWIRFQGEMKNEDVMKLFSVSAATARRYRQSAQKEE